MSVRPPESAAVRVTAVDPPLRYDLRWYDDTESIVPLWWLGVWGPGVDDLVCTEVLAGSRQASSVVLRSWLIQVVPPAAAAHLVTDASRTADHTGLLAS